MKIEEKVIKKDYKQRNLDNLVLQQAKTFSSASKLKKVKKERLERDYLTGCF
jgi:hypothetical protein